MDKKIAILRGINVGGNRPILMADLKTLFGEMGFMNVKTYIQSGNVIFNSPPELSNHDISTKVEKAIWDIYNFEVPVIVRSVAEIEQAAEKNPFAKEKEVDIKQLHLTFLKESPTKENRVIAESADSGMDRFAIDDDHVFIFCDGKYHQSKLINGFFERKLQVSATTRNWKTVLKIIELSK